MTWKPYELDRIALQIVLNAKTRAESSHAKTRSGADNKMNDKDSAAKKTSLGSLNQVYKMRAACAFGLERFWGEHLRLAHVIDSTSERKANQSKVDSLKHRGDREKAMIIIDTWLAFVGIMKTAGIELPNTVVDLAKLFADSDQGDAAPPKALKQDEIKQVTQKIWNLTIMENQACLSVLTSFCDAIVWWTQRLREGTADQEDAD
jgi:hypothetical protein